VTDLTRDALSLLVLIATVCGIAVVLLVVAGFLVAVARVAVMGRVLVVPFRGADERRGEITGLFARRLMEIEEKWTSAAHEIEDLSRDVAAKSTPLAELRDVETGTSTEALRVPPLVDGRALPLRPASIGDGASGLAVGAGPRDTGADFLGDILLLDEAGSLATADLGAISVGGVAFSPQNIFAFVRRLPELCARRVLTGTVMKLDADYILVASYEERSLGRRTRRIRRVERVESEDWLAAIDALAFKLAKARIDLLRHIHRRHGLGPRAVLAESQTQVAGRAVVEAKSWAACEAFLSAYISQLRHYLTGSAVDRDRALADYGKALDVQPQYSRATYHRATLLYNRYLPAENDEAVVLFESAAKSEDQRVRALSLAGLAMACAQAVSRFDRDAALAEKALQASEDAMKVEPDLEESRFARAWAYQLRKDWNRALDEYDAVLELQRTSAPARRIASFARNNAGFIWLSFLSQDPDALRRAEDYFWKALADYPNKIALGNLAEVARRCERYSDALLLFDHALALDDGYVNAWNERACVEVEIAAHPTGADDARARRLRLDEACVHHQRAVVLAEDEGYATKLRAAFRTALDRYGFETEAARLGPLHL
jgi:hypothetical protein